MVHKLTRFPEKAWTFAKNLNFSSLSCECNVEKKKKEYILYIRLNQVLTNSSKVRNRAPNCNSSEKTKKSPFFARYNFHSFDSFLRSNSRYTNLWPVSPTLNWTHCIRGVWGWESLVQWGSLLCTSRSQNQKAAETLSPMLLNPSVWI